MANRLAHLSDIDPHDHIFNSLFLNPDTTNSCQHYSLQNFNKSKIDSFLNLSLYNCNVRSFNSNDILYQALLSNLNRTPIVSLCLLKRGISPTLLIFNGYTVVHVTANLRNQIFPGIPNAFRESLK